MYIPIHYNVPSRYTLQIHIGLHFHIHWVTSHIHCVTFFVTQCIYFFVTQCIYICYQMYIQYTLGIYIGLHPNIHWVARHIHWVAFFVTQCIYKKMLPNVYTSKCTAMYIPNVYKMQHNVYPTLYIQGRAKRGVYTLGCILYTFGCILIYI